MKYLVIFLTPLALVYSLSVADSEGYARAEGSYLECMIKNPKATPLEISNCAQRITREESWRLALKYERLFKK